MSEAPDPEVVELATKIFDLARRGETEALVAYVDAGVPANLTNDRGDSLVMLAAYHGHAEAVRALLERGAEADRINDRGQTPSRGPSSRARRRSSACFWTAAPTRPRAPPRPSTPPGCSARRNCSNCSACADPPALTRYNTENGGGGTGPPEIRSRQEELPSHHDVVIHGRDGRAGVAAPRGP